MSSFSKKKVVIKLGSALITSNGTGLNIDGLQSWASQIGQLQALGHEVILVSSGAVAAGVVRLGWSSRPSEMAKLQAAAAVGQTHLVQAWEQAFSAQNLNCAQVLLDGADLSNRERYLNARAALLELMRLGAIPIINENDTVVTDEIRFGDNDSLAGLVANLVDADLLIILTDQKGLYRDDPRSNPDAEFVSHGDANDPELLSFAKTSKGDLGRGGMYTKLRAAHYASRSGTDTFIGDGLAERIIVDAVAGLAEGTLLSAGLSRVDARTRWLAGMTGLKGRIVIDNGAVARLQTKGASLLAVGVKSVNGDFNRGDLVVCESEQGQLIAKGLTNYSHKEIAILAGKPTVQREVLLGWLGEEELIHRDNMVVL